MNLPTGNTRTAAIIRTQQRARHRQSAYLHTVAAMRAHDIASSSLVPALVELHRVSAGHMDDDGLAASLKGVRDGIADALGVNDGGRFVTWKCGQIKGRKGSYGIEVRITPRGEAALRCAWCTTAPGVESCPRETGLVCRRCHAAKRLAYPCKCLTVAQACDVLNLEEPFRPVTAP